MYLIICCCLSFSILTTKLSLLRSLCQAKTSTHGAELYVHSEAQFNSSLGPQLVDIYPGIIGSEITAVTPLENGRIVFFALSPAGGSELWTTDCTVAGTRQLIDLVPGTTSATSPGTVKVSATEALVVFSDGYDYWYLFTDGNSTSSYRT